jgi:hypothetical protein
MSKSLFKRGDDIALTPVGSLPRALSATSGGYLLLAAAAQAAVPAARSCSLTAVPAQAAILATASCDDRPALGSSTPSAPARCQYGPRDWLRRVTAGAYSTLASWLSHCP